MFLRGPEPKWFFNNLTGQVLDDTYYAFFLTNDLPYLPQAVYQDPFGVTPWSNPIEFEPSGGLPDNLYFNPEWTYRIEIRQGPTQSDPLIWLIQDYTVGLGGGVPVVVEPLVYAENMITNPQFSDITFTSPLSLTTAGTYDIAVGWQLILVGTGTTTLTQIVGNGADDIEGNPPYYLTIGNTGWTSVTLVQRFSNNGALFAGGAIAIAFTAYSTGGNNNLTVAFVPSDGAETDFPVFVIPAGAPIAYARATPVNASTNTDQSNNAYVDLEFRLPASGTVTLSNVQLTGQSAPLSSDFLVNPTPPIFSELSYERVVDHEFHYYKPLLSYKPIPSYLVGWDFALNPAQFYGPTVTAQALGANTSYYAWDQTIVFQSVTSSIVVNQSANGGFRLNGQTGAQQAAIIQYIPEETARNILSQNIAVNLLAQTASGQTLNGTVSLWYTTDVSLPAINSNASIVATLDANGKPATFNGNWTEVPRPNGQEATFTLTDTVTDFPFTIWKNDDSNTASTTATYMAIVVGFATFSTAQDPLILSVSLCSGDIATRPAPQTLDQVLRECQYYYEKSYNPGVVPGTVTATGLVFAQAPCQWDGTNTNVWCPDIYLQFKQHKIKTPSLLFFGPDGTANVIQSTMKAGASAAEAAVNVPIANWTVTPSLGNAVLYSQLATGLGTQHTGFLIGGYGELLFHYICNAVLGT